MSINKKIVWNLFGSAINNGFPILIIPILIWKLGESLYGEMVVSLSLWGFIAVLVSYGFQVTGSKLIAENIKNEINNDQTIVTIIATKLILFLFGLFILIIYTAFKKNEISLLILTAPYAIGSAMNLNWLYIGEGNFREQAKIITTQKIISFIMIILFTLFDNLNALIVVHSAGIFILSCLQWYQCRIIKKINFSIEIRCVIFQLKESFPIFSVAGLSGFFQNIIPVVVYEINGSIYVTYYNVCMTLNRFGQQVVQAIFQVTFQHTNSKEILNKNDELVKIVRLLVYALIIIIMTIYMLSANIMQLSKTFELLVIPAIITIIYLILYILVNLFGVQSLVPLGKSSYLQRSSIIGVLLAGGMMENLIYEYSVAGAIMTLVTCEFLILLQLVHYHVKKNIRLVL